MYISIMKNFETFQESYRPYDEMIEKFYKQDTSTFEEADIENITKKAHEQKVALEKLKKELAPLEKILTTEQFKTLTESLNGSIELCGKLEESSLAYKDARSAENLNVLTSQIVLMQGSNDKLSNQFNQLEELLIYSLVSGVLTKQMDMGEFKEVIESLNPESNLHDQLEQVESYITTRKAKQEEGSVEKPQEQSTPQETNSTPATAPSETSTEIAEIEPAEMTLEEKIEQINFNQNGNMIAEVQELTVEDRMNQIQSAVDELEAKDQLTFRESIELQVLKTEQLELAAYSDTLDDQKLSRDESKRNRKLTSVDKKLEEAQADLKRSQKQYQKYQGRVMRFFSMRYQEQMAQNIQKLREKRGVLQDLQRKSAVAKFDKNSRKMMRNARIVGTATVIAQEIQLLQKDRARFKRRTKSDVRRLQGKVGARLEDRRLDAPEETLQLAA